jgi:hypothetical protein
MKHQIKNFVIFLGIFLFCRNAYGQSENHAYFQSGTGFAITTNGYIVTNYHVVYISHLKREGDYFEVTQTVNGETIKYKAKIVSTDPVSDLVILKIIDNNFKIFSTLPFIIKFQTAEKGSDVFTLSYPRTDIQGVETKVTKGNIVAQTGFRGEVGHYTISAPIDHGSSGGPLFDNEGNVIGVTDSGVSIEESKKDNEKPALNTSQFYAIKASKIAPMLDLLTDVQFPIQNTISNIPFTKKVKALEKYVFIVNTYTLDFNKEQNINQSNEKQRITNKEIEKQNQKLEIGTEVYILRQGYNKKGIITNIINSEKGYIYTITYKNKLAKSFDVYANKISIITKDGKVSRVTIKL